MKRRTANGVESWEWCVACWHKYVYNALTHLLYAFFMAVDRFIAHGNNARVDDHDGVERLHAPTVRMNRFKTNICFPFLLWILIQPIEWMAYAPDPMLRKWPKTWNIISHLTYMPCADQFIDVDSVDSGTRLIGGMTWNWREPEMAKQIHWMEFT